MARLVVELEGAQAERRARSLANELTRMGHSAGVVDTRFGRLGAGLTRMGRQFAMLGAAAAAAAVAVAAVVARRSLELYDTQARAIAQINAALASTGGIAGKTATELQATAAALQRATEFGDEAIMVVQSQLLTFTKIRGDVFDRTTEAVLNLSVRMDQDLRSSVVMLGKALNDPIANLGALGRAGIQFDDDQKELIKTLAETGRLEEAQALILEELTTQNENAARAARDAGSGMKPLMNAIGDLLEVVGAGLTPAIRDMARELESLAQDRQVVQLFQDIGAGAGALLGILAKLTDHLHDFRLGWLRLVSDAARAQAIVARANATITAMLAKAVPTEHLKKQARDLGDFATAAEEVAQRAALELFRALTNLGSAAEESGAATAGADDSTITLGRTADTVKGEIKALTDAIKEHEKAVREAESRIREAEKTYKEWKDAIDDVASALGDLDAVDLSEWVEENLGHAPETAEEWRNLADAIGEIEIALDALGDHGPIDPPKLAPDADVNLQLVDDAYFKEATENYRKLGAEAQAVMKRAWENIQDIAADALADILITGKVDFKELANSILKIFAQMLAKLLVMWAANAAQRAAMEAGVAAASGGGGGGGGGLSMGGIFKAAAKWMKGAGAGIMGALVITAAVGAFVAITHAQAKRRRERKWHDAVSIEDDLGLVSGAAWSKEFQQAALEAREGIRAILEAIGAELNSFPDILVQVRGSGKEFRSFVDGQLVGIFTSYEEALEFAILDAFRKADFSGVAPELADALARGAFTSVEQLLEVAEIFATIGEALDPMGSEIDALILRLDKMKAKLAEVGIGPEVLAEFEASEWQKIRDAITGTAKTAQQLFEEEREAFNRRVEMRRAELEAEEAAAKAQIAAAEGQVAMLKSVLAAMSATAPMYDRFLSQLAEAEALLAASTAAAAAARAALDSLPDPIGAGEFHGGGRGQRKADRERLEDILAEHELSKLDDFARALADANSKWDEAVTLAHGNAEALARINRARQEEIDLIKQQAIGSAYDDLLDFERAGRGDSSPFRDALREVNQEADRLRGVFGELGDTLGWSAERMQRIMRRIRDAAQAQREAILETGAEDLWFRMAEFLGMSEEAERMRFELTKAELVIAYEELKAAAAKYNIEVGLLEQLGDFVGQILDLDFDAWKKLQQPVRNVNRGLRDTNREFEEMARRLQQAKESIGDFLASLDRGELGGVSTMDSLAAAQAQFDEVLRQAKLGNIQALEMFPEVSRNLLDLAREAFASSPDFQAIFEMVRAAGQELLNVQRVTQDNIVFDERFFQAQHQQTATTVQGYTQTVNAVQKGADRTSGAVLQGARSVVDAINRQGDRQTKGLQELRRGFDILAASERRQRGAA